MLLLALLVATAVPPPACVVSGDEVSLDVLEVAKGLNVRVHDARVRATLGASRTTPVDVEGPISFRAKAPRLWLVLTRAVTTSDGLVELARGAQLVDARVVRGAGGLEVEGRAVLFASDVLEHENHKAPDRYVDNVRVPCDALGLEWFADDEQSDDGPEGADEAEAWSSFTARGEALRMRTAPREGASRTIRAAHCEGCIVVHAPLSDPAAAVGGWTFVVADGQGVRVQGWVRDREIELLPEDVGTGDGVMCTGDHDSNEMGFGWGGDPADRYEGPATLKKGARLFFDDLAWATVNEDVAIKVMLAKSAKDATVLSMPFVEAVVPAMIDVRVVDLVLP